jgi:hypothetical protein
MPAPAKKAPLDLETRLSKIEDRLRVLQGTVSDINDLQLLNKLDIINLMNEIEKLGLGGIISVPRTKPRPAPKPKIREKIRVVKIEQKPKLNVCSSCGSPQPPVAKFCSKCGKKMGGKR